jgi:hypothetical protein
VGWVGQNTNRASREDATYIGQGASINNGRGCLQGFAEQKPQL